MKVVLDTNIWLSAIVWRGESTKIIEAAINKKIEIIISEEILSEIIDVLNRAKFKDFTEDKKEKIEDLIRVILSISKLIKIKTKIDIINEDPKDNIILETAIDGKAEYIISYDNHLINMIQYKDVKMITPTKFLKII